MQYYKAIKEYAIIRKTNLNKLKCPKEIAYGSCEHYEKYSAVTGITRYHGQLTIDTIIKDSNLSHKDNIDFMSKVPTLNKYLYECTKEQGWIETHTPRNLIIGLIAETGELAQHFLWIENETTVWDRQKIDAICQELGDISIYLICLSDICNVEW